MSRRHHLDPERKSVQQERSANPDGARPVPVLVSGALIESPVAVRVDTNEIRQRGDDHGVGVPDKPARPAGVEETVHIRINHAYQDGFADRRMDFANPGAPPITPSPRERSRPVHNRIA